MPKWDKTRNYYGDLELSPSASADDIKKQYRKLAMKWHPDRNPGREAEVSPRFQLIQSAHEILSDENQKRQYDEARGSVKGRYTGASGVRGNPWANAAKDFAPPPRRQQPGASTSQARPPPPPPPSGAQRYANFTNGMPKASRPTAEDDAQWRRNTASAFENMRKGRNRAPPPTPPRSAAQDSRPSGSSANGQPPPPPPRTASQAQKAQASFGNSSRRTGFHPHSQGDEPPVTSKNYHTERTHSQFYEPPPPPPEPTELPTTPNAAPIPDPLAQFRENGTERRSSTPYNTRGGEKTGLFDDSPGVSRATSTRTPIPRKEVPGKARPRSTSPRRPTSSANQSRPDFPSPSHSRASERYTPRPETARDRPFFDDPASPTSPSHSKAGYRPSNLHSVYANPPAVPIPTSAFSTGSTSLGQPLRNELNWDTRPFLHKLNYTCCSLECEQETSDQVDAPSSGGLQTSAPSLLPQEAEQLKQVAFLVGRNQFRTTSENISTATRRGTPKSTLINITKQIDTEIDAEQANRKASCRFGEGIGAARNHSDPTMATEGSADNINMAFVPEEDSNGYQFTAGGTTEEVNTHSKARSQSAGRPIRRATGKSNKQSSKDPSPRESPQPQHPDGFSAGEWSEKISSQHFVPQPSNSTSTSPTRRGTGKKSKPIRRTTGTAGMVDSDDNEEWESISKPASSGFDSPVAMDIDTPPPNQSEPPPLPPKTRLENDTARSVPVEPNRPDWRAGDGTGPSEASQAYQEPARANANAGFSMPAMASPPPVPPYGTRPGGSEDTEEFRTTLSDLKQTEPFMDPPATGLKSFADLQSTLPFQSQASKHIPIEKKPVVPLEFPTAPVAPRLPPTVAVAGIRPNMAQWRKYAQDFHNYMDKWETFNGKVVEHFKQRQQIAMKRKDASGPNWLESPSAGGDPVMEYMNELHQDWDVRKKWTDACSDHKDRVREFYEFRERMK